jgi:hypothetical protein
MIWELEWKEENINKLIDGEEYGIGKTENDCESKWVNK